VADKQTVLKLIRFFMSRNTFTKFTKLVLRQFNLNPKCTETHLRASTFSKIFRGGDPFLQRVEGMRKSDSWERRVREGRGEEENVQSKQNLITPWIGLSAREMREAATCLWNYGVKVRQLRDYSNVVLKKIKEIETFVTTNCLIVMFFRLVFAFCLIFLVLYQHVFLILTN
jgi:hypothetical protein